MPCPSCNVCDEDHPPRLPAGFQLDEKSRRRPGRYRFAKLELANQSLRDQFQIAVKFQMILLGVAAAAAFHFKFFLLKNKSYHATPTTLRCDQRRNPLLVGGGSVGPREGTVQQSDRTKRQGTTHEHQPMPENSASIQRARPAPVPSPRSSSRRSFRAWFLGSRRYAPRLTWRTSVLYLFQVTIETLSEALSYGWRVTARCAHGKRDGMKSIKERLSCRARHGDAGMDTREKLPALAPGNAAAMPDVRLARRATDLHGATRNADGSWRKVGAEVKASRLGEPARGGPIEPACVPSR